MPAPRVWKHEIWQGDDLEPLDRILGRDEAVLVEADVTDIDIYVYERGVKTAIYSATGLDPSAGVNADNRVFDSLQVDGRWKRDSKGYNARNLILQSDIEAATGFMEGGKYYRVEIVWNTSAWGEVKSAHEYQVLAVYSTVS